MNAKNPMRNKILILSEDGIGISALCFCLRSWYGLARVTDSCYHFDILFVVYFLHSL